MVLEEILKIDKQALNKNQKEAILNTEGPLLIIAGPGAGKTKTLVERVVYLISKGVNAENILVATFTEKAAKELVTRISNRLLQLGIDINLNEMYIGTLHSIFLRILEEYREFTSLNRNYNILDQFDQRYLIFRNINRFTAVENSDFIWKINLSNWIKADIVVKYVSKIAEEYIDPDELYNSDEPDLQVIGNFYKEYQNLLKEENVLDFATIQSKALGLLEDNPDILAELQNKIKYIMIDEYQDTNTIQERLILLLADKHKNICVVGDDDQSLYRFRGASIRNILEFSTHFEKGTCKKVTLDTNYRSHPDIINFYNRFMNRHNWNHNGKTFRYEKTIKPNDGEFPNIPAVIKVSKHNDTEAYHQEVYNFIKDLKDKGVLTDYNQIAFLFKSVQSDQAIGLAEFLEDKGIPVFSPRSKMFFEREEIRLLIGAFVTIFPNLFQRLKWNDTAELDIWDYYRGCQVEFMNEFTKDSQTHKTLYKWTLSKMKAHNNFSQSTNYAFAALLYQLLEFPMFSKYLDVNLQEKKTDLRATYNIAMFSKLLFKFEHTYNFTVFTEKNIDRTLKELFNKFLRFLKEGGLEEYEDFEEYAPSGCISFMTIHQSKGLEFPIVIVGSLNASPRKQYDDIDLKLQSDYYHKPPFEPIEKTKYYDFYRLFYTAFSRPQNLLVLSACTREGQGRTPSKHFADTFNKLPSWTDERFKPELLELENLKPINIKREYAFTSDILLYENCPLQYKFYKELGFVEVRTGGVLGGSLLHQTIEDIHRAVLKKEENKLTNDNITDWFNRNYQLLSKQQRSYLHQGQLNALLKQVLRYRDRNQSRWNLILETEVDVSLVKEDYILKGTIDLIKGDNETVELVDFKSGDKPDVNSTDPKERKLLNQYQRQLEVYAHIIEKNKGVKISKLHLCYPKEDDGIPYITFKANIDNINATIDIFSEVVNRIESKDYDMSRTPKGEKQCGECDMRYYCNPHMFSE
ncbi:ATP-dependent DNA helicase [Apibacter sp. B2912]|uniref:ATP-dependent helicase n=1 Tax=Apibacter sp. B2912 TaxID=2656763 RepID=UPI0013689F0E|nr:ATP-dependent DNA helicase [Apibacter sp. B2912]MXO32676.1 AAA family ATPase [Apibacter sp. B2912]